MKLNNKYYILRHGEAMSNVKKVVSSWPEKFKNPLTERGIEMIKESALKLKNTCAEHGRSINFIFASPLLRTRQTAEIVGKILKIKPKTDQRLKEIDFGNINGSPITDVNNAFKKESERIYKAMPEGENYNNVLNRVYNFLIDIDKKYKGKNILLVSHECPLWVLEAKVNGISLEEVLKTTLRDHRIHKGEVRELN